MTIAEKKSEDCIQGKQATINNYLSLGDYLLDKYHNQKWENLPPIFVQEERETLEELRQATIKALLSCCYNTLRATK